MPDPGAKSRLPHRCIDQDGYCTHCGFSVGGLREHAEWCDSSHAGAARERARIVAYLRNDDNFGDWYGSYAHQHLADMIERGDHTTPTTMPEEG